jgi:hypothetical protein
MANSHAVNATSGISAADINQFLQTHGVTVIRQGANARYAAYGTPGGALDVFNSFAGHYTPAGQYLDAPFTLNTSVVSSSVTGGVTARLPISINSTVSSALIANSLKPGQFETAVDCNVSIVGDNGYGVPDFTNVYGTALLPAEFIEATSSDEWPEPQESLLGSLSSDGTVWDVIYPPYTGVPILYGIGSLVYTTAGTWAVAAGGAQKSSGRINTSVAYAQFSNGILSTWRNGPSLPTPSTSGQYYLLESLPYAPTAGVLVMTGCGTSNTISGSVTNTNVCFTATFGQDGTFGGWQQQANLPHNVSGCYVTVITLVDASGTTQDYALVFDTTPTFSRNAIYYGQIASDGSISSWSTISNQAIENGQPFPIGISSTTASNQAAQASGTTAAQVTTGTVDTIVVAIVNDAAGYVSSAVASLDASGTLSFSPWDTTPTSVLQYNQNTLSGVYGDTIVSSSHAQSSLNISLAVAASDDFTDVTVNPFAQVAPTASGGPQGTNGASWYFPNGDGTYSAFGTSNNDVVPFVAQLSTTVYPLTWVNVPIVLTKPLPTFNQLHLILQFAEPTGKSQGVNVAMTSALGSTVKYSLTGATGSWNPITYDGVSVNTVEIPWQLWVGDYVTDTRLGEILAIVDDTTGKVSYFWTGPLSQSLMAAAQWTANERSCQLVNYDAATGKMKSITEVT